jgi:hypothetical protein
MLICMNCKGGLALKSFLAIPRVPNVAGSHNSGWNSVIVSNVSFVKNLVATLVPTPTGPILYRW